MLLCCCFAYFAKFTSVLEDFDCLGIVVSHVNIMKILSSGNCVGVQGHDSKGSLEGSRGSEKVTGMAFRAAYVDGTRSGRGCVLGKRGEGGVRLRSHMKRRIPPHLEEAAGSP
jgi:hypothetical protein